MDGENQDTLTLDAKYSDKTNKVIKIEVIGTDSKGANLEYKIFTKTVATDKKPEGEWIEGGVLSEQKSGETVLITAEGLKTFTEYYWKVEVSNGEIEKTVENPEVIRTYCNGTGYSCNGTYTICSLCNGNKTNVCSRGVFNIDKSKPYNVKLVVAQKCAFCRTMTSGSYGQAYTCPQCKITDYYSYNLCNETCADNYFSNYPSMARSKDCHKCNGLGFSYVFPCTHGLDKTHSYCSHEKTEKHDTL